MFDLDLSAVAGNRNSQDLLEMTHRDREVFESVRCGGGLQLKMLAKA